MPLRQSSFFMTDNLRKCLETICNFPTIYNTGDKSPFHILKQSGYADISDLITEDKILSFIDNKSDLIETWIKYTEDIRHSPAWGLRSNSKSKWTVFYFDNGKVKTEFKFDDPFKACAKLIKETMNEING